MKTITRNPNKNIYPATEDYIHALEVHDAIVEIPNLVYFVSD